VRSAIDAILAEEEEMAVFRQMYDHLALAAGDRQVADRMLALSSGQHGPGGSFLKRMLRFAVADAYANTVQMLVVDFLRTADKQTIRAVLAQLAGMEWTLDPDDRHQRMTPPDFVVNDADAEIRRFRELGLIPGDAHPGRSLARSDEATWEVPDQHRIRTWRRRYVEAHRQSLDWARAKAEEYRWERERLAPYGHPDGLEAAVVLQLRQEADRAASARLFQIDDSLGRMALRSIPPTFRPRAACCSSTLPSHCPPAAASSAMCGARGRPGPKKAGASCGRTSSWSRWTLRTTTPPGHGSLR
jgi:hypothetical protein